MITLIISALSSKTFKYVVSPILVALLLVFSYNFFANKYIKEGYQKAKSEDIEHLLKQEQKARAIEKSYQLKLAKAQNDKVSAQNQLFSISKSTNDSFNGLRNHINSYNNELPRNSQSANIDRITTLSNVFSECAGKYKELAETADKQLIDLKMIVDSFPK